VPAGCSKGRGPKGKILEFQRENRGKLDKREDLRKRGKKSCPRKNEKLGGKVLFGARGRNFKNGGEGKPS